MMNVSIRFLASLLVVVALGFASEGIAVHGSPPGEPDLPDEPYNYVDPDLPRHFASGNRRGGRIVDNTPDDNLITDHGATLGRVLFYDTRLSGNDTVACGSCHLQEHGFSDPDRLSTGLNGELTARHSMALANARYYSRGRFFWDDRAATLEDQVLMPIQDTVEMGMSLDPLEAKLAAVDFYPPLFENAFGSAEITSDRISQTLAQFVRSLVSYQSKYDEALSTPSDGDRRGFGGFNEVFTEQELVGPRLFGGAGRRGRGGGRGGSCARCHNEALQFSSPRNNGLDAVTDADNGTGRGRFKAPSLRNIAVRAPYMHDGRFATLREVVEQASRPGTTVTRMRPSPANDGGAVVGGEQIISVRSRRPYRACDGGASAAGALRAPARQHPGRA